MSALLDRVPADIAGIRRRCSPVLMNRDADVDAAADPHRGIVRDCGDGWATVVFEDDDEDPVRAEFPSCGGGLEDLTLDLTDATGRAHAAAWLTHQQSGALVRRLDRADYDVFLLARDFSAMTPEQIDTLARLVYRAAGRLP
jgi:hypothetical protein